MQMLPLKKVALIIGLPLSFNENVTRKGDSNTVTIFDSERLAFDTTLKESVILG